MIKENLQLLKRLHLVSDLTLTAVAFFSSFLAFFIFASDPNEVAILCQRNCYLVAIILPIWLFFLAKSPQAYSYRMKAFHYIAIQVLKPILKASGVLIAYLTVTGNLMEIRNQVILFIVLDAIFMDLFRRFIQSMLQFFRVRGRNLKSFLIVGTGKQACEFFDLAKSNSHWGISVLGLLSENGDCPHNGKSSLVIGNLSDLPRILNRNPVDEVYISLPMSSFHKVENLVAQCQVQGITAHVAADFIKANAPTFSANDLFGTPVLSFSAVPRRLDLMLIKRIVDIVVSSVMLLLLSPVFMIIAMAIKLDSKGPIFYRWKVVGHNRKEFNGYKFRSMVAAADGLKVQLLSKNEMKGVVFKIKNDPRITPVGKFLRKYSLDELPQLYNVFKGDMSLVGPRPPLQTEIDGFADWQRRKLSVKPGITCLWQVSGRNRINDFDEWVKLDLEYIDRWSLWLDLKILARTIPAVITGKGAS
ncbi:MAG: sugar transferase [candidate division Zixibacteria bacterium CG_4_9_14_3_um_filter_46_8]|nr:MAG: sugar transferase [candidate division Zixibacteria bacterium CG_4_9_14_3_um_filter_46_8]